MGNVAPRRRIMNGVNVYSTPQKNNLRNSMQTPDDDKINMTEGRAKSLSQYSNTKSGANLFRRGGQGTLPTIGGNTMMTSMD